ncbi:MAG: hypothetical protein WC511_02705 [Candidatus Pacearchaeota archaeon]
MISKYSTLKRLSGTPLPESELYKKKRGRPPKYRITPEQKKNLDQNNAKSFAKLIKNEYDWLFPVLEDAVKNQDLESVEKVVNEFVSDDGSISMWFCTTYLGFVRHEEDSDILVRDGEENKPLDDISFIRAEEIQKLATDFFIQQVRNLTPEILEAL